jgi:hypothetical protein
MLQIGYHITGHQDPLKNTTIDSLYEQIIDNESTLSKNIAQLRALYAMDPNAYRSQKTKLPYLVCSQFISPYRKKDYFSQTSFIILDIDHIAAYGRDLSNISEIVYADQRVKLGFVSPSGNGLKLLFELAEPIHDSGYYSLFYKSFALQFSIQYQLEGMIDMKTCDVARCCFLSYDPKAIYRKDAEKIDHRAYTNHENINFESQINKEVNEIQKKIKENLPETIAPNPQNLDNKILEEIKNKIKPLRIKKVAKDIVQPKELELLMQVVKDKSETVNLQINECEQIQYGMKVKFVAQHLFCTINIYYGKKGFTIVKSPKTGSSIPLANLAVEFLDTCIEQFENNTIDIFD